MAVFAVAITKTVPWRGQDRRVSNVYHYKTLVGQPFPDQEVVDELVAAEKALYASTAKFVEARTWGPTETGKANSKMREVYSLTGVGTNTAGSVTNYREMAILVYWKLGRYGSRNHPQFLRKWHHTGRDHGLPADGSRATTGTPTDVATYEARVRDLNPAGLVDNLSLCTPDGEHLPLSTGVLYPFLEHRQIGR